MRETSVAIANPPLTLEITKFWGSSPIPTPFTSESNLVFQIRFFSKMTNFFSKMINSVVKDLYESLFKILQLVTIVLTIV